MILPPHQRGNLTNTQWQRLKPLLPAQKPTVGRPNNDHRQTLNGMCYGFSGRAHRGEICQSAMELGKRYRVGSTAGDVGAFGTGFSSPCSNKPMSKAS
jgi:hypothetical protein